MWLFKRKTQEGLEVYDLTSAAVRAVLLVWQGFVHGVSDAHAQDIREYDPQIWTETIYAMTNGDLIPGLYSNSREYS